MDIAKNIFTYVSEIRDFNKSIESFNTKLEQYFSLEFSYFKTKYLFEKNVKSNILNNEKYNRTKKQYELLVVEFDKFKNSFAYKDWHKKQEKLSRAIEFYNKELKLENLQKSKKDELEKKTNKTLNFRKTFKNDEKNREISLKKQEYEKKLQNLKLYLNENSFLQSYDINKSQSVSKQIKEYFYEKENLFEKIKVSNMAQENTRLSEIINKVEKAQSQGTQFATVILDNRFQLKEINYSFYINSLKEKLFNVVSKNDFALVEKFVGMVKQKFSQIGFEKNEGKQV